MEASLKEESMEIDNVIKSEGILNEVTLVVEDTLEEPPEKLSPIKNSPKKSPVIQRLTPPPPPPIQEIKATEEKFELPTPSLIIHNTLIRCCIPKCPNHSNMNVDGLEFWKFPSRLKKRMDWIKAIRTFVPSDQKTWLPNSEDRICNGHFFKKLSLTQDPKHPSYLPLFFPGMDKAFMKKLRSDCSLKLKQLYNSDAVTKKMEIKRNTKSMNAQESSMESKDIKICSVVGCYNSSENWKIIPFPHKAANQYKLWISALDRISSDGSPWIPNPGCGICTEHFYGGKVTYSNPNHPSFSPVYFPHNRDVWDLITERLKDINDSEVDIHNTLKDLYKQRPNTGRQPLSADSVRITFPGWLENLTRYVSDCKTSERFTDMIISNGSQSFEGHKIILMSASPLIKMALHDLEETDEKPVVLIPDMSSQDIRILEKVVYGTSCNIDYKKFGSTDIFTDNSSDDFKMSTHKVEEVSPLTKTDLIISKSSTTATLNDKNISSDDFFRIYNNVARSTTVANVQDSNFENCSPNVPTILTKIRKQVTGIRAINPKKFVLKEDDKKYTVVVQTVKKSENSNCIKSLPSQSRSLAEVRSLPYCSACEIEFETNMERDVHKVCHLTYPDNNPDSYACKFCERIYKSKELKRIHEAQHIKDGWMCEICDKKFSSAPRLLHHSFTHKPTMRFLCQYCSKGFRVKAKLTVHENMHRNISKYKCEFCSRLFATAKTLGDHMNSHTGIKPYICDKCGKSFCTSASLYQHRSRMHKNSDKISCQFCNKKFKTKFQLDNHADLCEIQFITD